MYDDDIPLIPCPYCREEILEDAQRCPHCENYISAEDSASRRSPFIWVMLGLSLLITVYWVFI